jgi:hypothetical protein
MSTELSPKQKEELEMFKLREFKKVKQQNNSKFQYDSHFCEELNTAAKFIKEKLGTAEIAVVMGSGLNDFYELLDNAKVLDYTDIPGEFHFFKFFRNAFTNYFWSQR